MFFACASGDYVELKPLYKFCVNRVYPEQEVVVLNIDNPSVKRFLIHPTYIPVDYVHVTDIDILILPQEKTHQEYYTSHAHMGACYLGGVKKSKTGIWDGTKRRVAGGEVGFLPEYYQRTSVLRHRFLSEPISPIRENDEIVLCRILKHAGYPIPDVYKFPDGEPWDINYRDLHLGDFRGKQYMKWNPDKNKIRDLVSEPEFISIYKTLSTKWQELIERVVLYSQEYDHSDYSLDSGQKNTPDSTHLEQD
jgi:hypothetical protein